MVKLVANRGLLCTLTSRRHWSTILFIWGHVCVTWPMWVTLPIFKFHLCQLCFGLHQLLRQIYDLKAPKYSTLFTMQLVTLPVVQSLADKVRKLIRAECGCLLPREAKLMRAERAEAVNPKQLAKRCLNCSLKLKETAELLIGLLGSSLQATPSYYM